MSTTVYFNGAYLSKDEVRISPDDRGFLFADGVYEVVRSYGGRLFELDAHLERLADGLGALEIAGVDHAAVRDVFPTLLRRNGLEDGEAIVYLQITRGAAPRRHAYPDPPVAPTVYVEARVFAPRGDPNVGVGVITVPDTRWAWCDIKSVALLPNCLANEQARQADALDALFVRDGVVLEASAASVFAVMNGQVRTAPLTNYILPSISRAVVVRVCRQAGIPVAERPVFLSDLAAADELFLAGTTLEVMPIVTVDQRVAGGGRPGPVTRQIAELFRAETARAA